MSGKNVRVAPLVLTLLSNVARQVKIWFIRMSSAVFLFYKTNVTRFLNYCSLTVYSATVLDSTAEKDSIWKYWMMIR